MILCCSFHDSVTKVLCFHHISLQLTQLQFSSLYQTMHKYQYLFSISVEKSETPPPYVFIKSHHWFTLYKPPVNILYSMLMQILLDYNLCYVIVTYNYFFALLIFGIALRLLTILVKTVDLCG